MYLLYRKAKHIDVTAPTTFTIAYIQLLQIQTGEYLCRLLHSLNNHSSDFKLKEREQNKKEGGEEVRGKKITMTYLRKNTHIKASFDRCALKPSP